MLALQNKSVVIPQRNAVNLPEEGMVKRRGAGGGQLS